MFCVIRIFPLNNFEWIIKEKKIVPFELPQFKYIVEEVGSVNMDFVKCAVVIQKG